MVRVYLALNLPIKRTRKEQSLSSVIPVYATYRLYLRVSKYLCAVIISVNPVL